MSVDIHSACCDKILKFLKVVVIACIVNEEEMVDPFIKIMLTPVCSSFRLHASLGRERTM